jgi:chromosome segregation ATPase
MKRKLDASEREKEELQKQVTELQADLKEQQRISLQAETDSAKMAGLLDQIESLKEERTELKAQVSQLRNETARLDSDHRAVVAETTRLKTANSSLQQQHARLEQETSIARSSLAQEHAVEMARRSALSEQELHELTEQWKSDVATRDERIASTEAIAQDLQSLLSESHTRSEMLEAQAQELAAESEEMMTGLKTAHRAEISELQGSLEDSLLARQVLEERIASGESEAALLRNAVEEMRRQLQVAAMKHQGEEESWALKQQEYDAKTEREARRSAALEKRVASLQQEVTNLGKSAASGDGLASPAVQASRQLTWYSEQLEATQNNARRLQRETDRVTRESRLLGEQLSDAKAEAKALRAEAKEAKDELRRLRAERQFSLAAGAEATASNPRCVAAFLVSLHHPRIGGHTDCCSTETETYRLMLSNTVLFIRSFSASSGTGTPTIGRQGAGLGTEFDNKMQRASRLREMAHSPVLQSSTSAPVAARPTGSRLGVPPVGVAPRRADAKGVSSGSPATNRSNEARDAGGGDSPATGNEQPPPSPLRAAPVGAGASQRGDKRPDEAWSDYYARRAAGN